MPEQRARTAVVSRVPHKLSVQVRPRPPAQQDASAVRYAPGLPAELGRLAVSAYARGRRLLRSVLWQRPVTRPRRPHRRARHIVRRRDAKHERPRPGRVQQQPRGGHGQQARERRCGVAGAEHGARVARRDVQVAGRHARERGCRRGEPCGQCRARDATVAAQHCRQQATRRQQHAHQLRSHAHAAHARTARHRRVGGQPRRNAHRALQ
eukprot:169346-Chlamydomonas_euryale.AAC.5